MRKLILICAVLALLAGQAWAEPRYTVTVLPLEPVAINNKGHVVGNRKYPGREQNSMALWRNGGLLNLDPTDVYKGRFGAVEAVDVNDVDQVLALGVVHEPIRTAPFFWSKGKLTKMANYSYTGSRVEAMNNKGQIVGDLGPSWVEDPNGRRAGYWPNGSSEAEDLNAKFGWRHSEACDINNYSDIVGWYTSDDSSCHLFLLSGGKIILLDSGPQPNCLLLNDKRQVLSTRMEKGSNNNYIPHTYLYEKGKQQELGSIEGWQIWAKGINNRGQIILSAVKGNDYRPFLWQNGKFTDLNKLVPQGKGLMIREAVDINDRGEIIAKMRKNGKDVGLLQRPVKNSKSRK